MSDIILRAENLGKKFYIGSLQQQQASTLANRLTNPLLTPLRLTRRLLRGEISTAANLDQELWALQDINFEVKRGEVLGIIGRNGAGKTTLLKILSRITSPTTGSINIYGRIAALLEVGTGFHPELTGRENIHMNAAILGMDRQELQRKFDEIVAFSGVEKFIDTPIKFYSSGMVVRLGFSVAAHLEPEILIIDEVLSVGDAAFQKKSMGKMEGFASEGRTVLFVSHNMGAILRMVGRCLLIEQGRIVSEGHPKDVVGAYLAKGVEKTGEKVFEVEEAKYAQISCLRVFDSAGNSVATIDPAEDIRIEVDFVIRDDQRGHLDVVVNLSLPEGLALFSFSYQDSQEHNAHLERGHYRLHVTFPGGLLNVGDYTVRAAVNLNHKSYHGHPTLGEGVALELSEISEIGASGYRGGRRQELLLVDARHDLKKLD